jgi:hypothetical protein
MRLGDYLVALCQEGANQKSGVRTPILYFICVRSGVSGEVRTVEWKSMGFSLDAFSYFT